MNSLVEWFLKKVGIENINAIIINSILAAFLFIAGIFIGWIIVLILRRVIEKTNLKRYIRHSFIELVLTVFRWSIYIIFLNLALQQFNIPEITNWITSILLIFPALVGSLILIGIGFAIAVYLSELINESGIIKAEVLSMIMFYFITYVFVVFAAKTALISLDKNTVNIIIISLTIVVALAISLWQIKKQPKKHEKYRQF